MAISFLADKSRVYCCCGRCFNSCIVVVVNSTIATAVDAVVLEAVVITAIAQTPDYLAVQLDAAVSSSRRLRTAEPWPWPSAHAAASTLGRRRPNATLAIVSSR